eukprot:6208661-Pleurochrysis_carterae.AAC.2
MLVHAERGCVCVCGVELSSGSGSGAAAAAASAKFVRARARADLLYGLAGDEVLPLAIVSADGEFDERAGANAHVQCEVDPLDGREVVE